VIDNGQPLGLRLHRRVFPLLATLVLIAIGMASTIWWGPAILHKTTWSLPDDLWSTLVAARRVYHLNLAGLYSQGTGLISFPGTAVILVPAVALISAFGLSLGTPGAANPHPAAWLIAGPYMIALSAVALFAADALAEHLGVSWPRRALLSAAEGAALWGVSVQWGHPEDAVAVGLLLYAVLALAQDRPARAGWLIGAAVAIQPLVLIVLPMLVMVVGLRRIPGFLARAAAPGAVLLGVAAAANWNATFHAVTSQPNWPSVDKPTPWLLARALAPQLSDGSVAAGPLRVIAIAVACCLALAAGRRWRTAADAAALRRPVVPDVLWWVAFALALRVGFEPVMVAYYVWPALAVALITAAATWPRLLVATTTSALVTFGSQVSWRGYLTWWAPVIALLAATLIAGRPRQRLWSAQLEYPGRVLPQYPVGGRNGQVEAVEFGQAPLGREEREVAAPEELPG
jgi:hypothetical protein